MNNNVMSANHTDGRKYEQYPSSTLLGERTDDEREIEDFADIADRRRIRRLSSGTIDENVRRVQRELCLIKLCWPRVPLTEDSYVRLLPDAYRCVSDKERLLLWYTENFRRQFHAKHADRRPLLLACDNECDVQVGKISFKRT